MLNGMPNPNPNPGWFYDFIRLYLVQSQQNQPNDGTQSDHPLWDVTKFRLQIAKLFSVKSQWILFSRLIIFYLWVSIKYWREIRKRIYDLMEHLNWLITENWFNFCSRFQKNNKTIERTLISCKPNVLHILS